MVRSSGSHRVQEGGGEKNERDERERQMKDGVTHSCYVCGCLAECGGRLGAREPAESTDKHT